MTWLHSVFYIMQNHFLNVYQCYPVASVWPLNKTATRIQLALQYINIFVFYKITPLSYHIYFPSMANTLYIIFVLHFPIFQLAGISYIFLTRYNSAMLNITLSICNLNVHIYYVCIISNLNSIHCYVHARCIMQYIL